MKHKMVKIKWTDSKFEREDVWTYIDEIYPKAAIINSIGYVVKDNKKHITIAGSVGNGQAAGVITIPKCSILKIKSIK